MDIDIGTTDWVYCPYDPNHRMRYSKFHNHLVKCREAHPDDPREPCPYYASELIHPDDMKAHLLICRYKNLYGNVGLDDSSLPVYDAPCHFDFDEESDEDDDDLETCISIKHDDQSSLFSETTKSYRPGSCSSRSLYKIREKYRDESETESSIFEYEIEKKNKKNPKKEVENSSDENINKSIYSMRSMSIGSTSTSSPSTTPSPSTSSYARKVGFGRGMVVKKLLSSPPSTKNNSLKAGFGRGALLRLHSNSS